MATAIIPQSIAPVARKILVHLKLKSKMSTASIKNAIGIDSTQLKEAIALMIEADLIKAFVDPFDKKKDPTIQYKLSDRSAVDQFLKETEIHSPLNLVARKDPTSVDCDTVPLQTIQRLSNHDRARRQADIWDAVGIPYSLSDIARACGLSASYFAKNPQLRAELKPRTRPYTHEKRKFHQGSQEKAS